VSAGVVGRCVFEKKNAAAYMNDLYEKEKAERKNQITNLDAEGGLTTVKYSRAVHGWNQWTIWIPLRKGAGGQLTQHKGGGISKVK